MSCTPARIILGVLAPFMIGFGIYSTLISVEQFNIVSLLGSDSLKPNNDELVAREGGIGAAWIAKYNKGRRRFLSVFCCFFEVELFGAGGRQSALWDKRTGRFVRGATVRWRGAPR